MSVQAIIHMPDNAYHMWSLTAYFSISGQYPAGTTFIDWVKKYSPRVGEQYTLRFVLVMPG